MKKKTVTSETEEITIDNKKQKRKREKKAYREIRWDRLDNTAHLFPVIAGENMSNVYRISVTLTELVQPDILQQALNIVLPKMDGFEVCQHIREFSDMPIGMLTAKSDESDELTGFELGVDEYISKPFSPKILVARVNALLRRSGLTAGNDEKFVEAGGIKLDKTAHLVTVDGRPIELSIKEFELLDYFMENQGIALSREKILNNVWNYDYFGDARTIDTHVKKLRAKIGEKGEYIKTIWGVGYKFIVE